MCDQKLFGHLTDGRKTSIYEIKNGRISAEITDFGARIRRIMVPDRAGRLRDVCLGCETIEGYEQDAQSFGAVVGRVANRISGGRFVLDGEEYLLEKNEGENHLHGASGAFSKKIWSVDQYEPDTLKLSLLSESGEAGYPGSLSVFVTYTLTDKDELKISYRAETDTKTICNITNHSYFNLDGHGSGPVYDQYLMIDSDRFAEAGPDCIPTGRMLPVDGTPLDFRTPKKIGRDIVSGYDQLNLGGGSGYDSAYELKNNKGIAASAWSDKSGIRMDMFTDSPSLQLYTGNFLDGQEGKDGAVYYAHSAFCLESQFFPDAINHDEFVSPIVRVGEPWLGTTVYRFDLI